MKSFLTGLLGLVLMVLPGLKGMMHEKPKLPPTQVEVEAAAAKEKVLQQGSRVMNKTFLTSFGLVLATGFMLWPEIKGLATSENAKQAVEAPPSRALPPPRVVDATAEDERAPERPPWPRQVQQNEVCEWVQVSPDWDAEICHQAFERPAAYPEGYQPIQHHYQMPRPCPQRGGCPLPARTDAQIVRDRPKPTQRREHRDAPQRGYQYANREE